MHPCCSSLLLRYVNVHTLKLILQVSSGLLWPASCHIFQLYGCNHLDASLLILCSSKHFNFQLARLFNLNARDQKSKRKSAVRPILNCFKIQEIFYKAPKGPISPKKYPFKVQQKLMREQNGPPSTEYRQNTKHKRNIAVMKTKHTKNRGRS